MHGGGESNIIAGRNGTDCRSSPDFQVLSSDLLLATLHDGEPILATSNPFVLDRNVIVKPASTHGSLSHESTTESTTAEETCDRHQEYLLCKSMQSSQASNAQSLWLLSRQLGSQGLCNFHASLCTQIDECNADSCIVHQAGPSWPPVHIKGQNSQGGL